MKKIFSSTLDAYRRYKIAKSKSKLYRLFNIFSYSLLFIIGAYVMLVSFPQVLFAHEVSYKNFKVYSREPINDNIGGHFVSRRGKSKAIANTFRAEQRLIMKRVSIDGEKILMMIRITIISKITKW